MTTRSTESPSPLPASPGPGRPPLNSVSTRIILCVLVSTVMTSLIVSWLAVGALREDARERSAQKARLVLDERALVFDRAHEADRARLSAAAAIGTAWHAEILQAFDDASDVEIRVWSRAGSPDVAGPPLPAPPAPLADAFEHIELRRADRRALSESACVSVGADVLRPDATLVGRLVGCRSRDEIETALQAATPALRGLRLMIADAAGTVRAAGGFRAERRLGARLPMIALIAPNDGELADYTDREGARLVGRALPVARRAWFLVAETDRHRVFEPAMATVNRIFVVDVCIVLFFSVLAYRVTRAIMQPIDALSRGAQRIAEGHVDYEIPTPPGDDELTLLTRTFNGMMRRLRSNQTEIENERLRLEEKNEELQRANEILAQLSITDGLTKLHNHRYFQDHLTREIKRVSRTQDPLSLILLDIDDFKLLNDTHGHAAGDEVLVSLAAIMNDSARESDLIARYGGEEFVVLMPNTDLPGAVHLAEKIRMTVESTRLIIGNNMKPIDITISLGVARFSGDRRSFFVEADKALYAAKAAGKNCVVIAGADGHEPVPPTEPTPPSDAPASETNPAETAAATPDGGTER